MGCVLGLHAGPLFGAGLFNKLHFGVDLCNEGAFGSRILHQPLFLGWFYPSGPTFGAGLRDALCFRAMFHGRFPYPQYFQKVIPHQFDSCPDKLILRAFQVKYNPKKMKR